MYYEVYINEYKIYGQYPLISIHILNLKKKKKRIAITSYNH